ncbi:hypothetical protein SAMN05216311_102556 [Chitinophaga sp. CF418]|nr:hypothetical protein SAMN05216311_102556 [Chitinophaga sp. CF418]
MTLICILSQQVVFRKLTLKRLPFYSISLRFAHPAAQRKECKNIEKVYIPSHPYLYNPIKSNIKDFHRDVGSA